MHFYPSRNRCIFVCLLASLVALACTASAQTSTPSFSDKDLQSLLIRMQANQQANLLLQQQYTSDELWHNRNFDKNGKLTLDETAKYENIALEGLLYRRKVEQNGKPLSGKEVAAEQARYNKAVAERRAMTPAQKRLSLHRSYNFSLPLAYLATLFDNRALRREQLNGRDTLVVESTPKADAKPANDAEKSSLDWKETTWIDIADAMPARFEAEQLVDKKQFLKGLTIQMDDVRIVDAAGVNGASAKPIWLLNRTVARGQFKMMWIKVSYVTEQSWSNFKRFHVDMRLLDDTMQEVPSSAAHQP